MADVIQKCFSNLPIHNGYAVTGVQKNGDYQSLAPTNEYGVASGLFNAVLSDRLDDVRYYTGDTAS